MLYLGPYTETLAGETWDALICDPPFGARTHAGSDDLPGNRRAIDYHFWTPRDVRRFIDFVAPRTRSWIGCITDTDLFPAYRAAYKRHGLYYFAPVPIIQPRHRATGDGPASCAVYLMLARPRTAGYFGGLWKPGYYYAEIERNSRIGGKPLSLMRDILRHYSNPGDTVCDPTAGWGTTLRAAQETGRLWLGSEMDPHAHAVATKRLAQPYTPPLFDDAHPAQTGIFDEADR